MLCVRAFCFRNFSEVLFIANLVHQINDEIHDKEVRLIGDEGEQLGIMSAEEALKIAAERAWLFSANVARSVNAKKLLLRSSSLTA